MYGLYICLLRYFCSLQLFQLRRLAARSFRPPHQPIHQTSIRLNSLPSVLMRWVIKCVLDPCQVAGVMLVAAARLAMAVIPCSPVPRSVQRSSSPLPVLFVMHAARHTGRTP